MNFFAPNTFCKKDLKTMCYKKSKPWIHVQNLEATFYTKFERIESWKSLSQILEMKFQWIKLSKCWQTLEVQFQKINPWKSWPWKSKACTKVQKHNLSIFENTLTHIMKTLKMKNPTKNCNNLASNIQQRKPCWTLLETLSNNDPQNMSH
jgi:hypothetical protein